MYKLLAFVFHWVGLVLALPGLMLTFIGDNLEKKEDFNR